MQPFWFRRHLMSPVATSRTRILNRVSGWSPSGHGGSTGWLSAGFGRWAFGIGQPRRDRRGRTGIVKGRSVRSGGNVLTTLSCLASGIFVICCDLTRPTITRLARTLQSTRMRRRREQYMPSVAFCLCHFLADFTICMCEFDFRQAQGLLLLPLRVRHSKNTLESVSNKA
jgi:hypothetical protein